MIPPMLGSLGPITDWLSSRRIGGLSAKYDEVSRASSAAKVHCCRPRHVCKGHANALAQVESAHALYEGSRRCMRRQNYRQACCRNVTHAIAATSILLETVMPGSGSCGLWKDEVVHIVESLTYRRWHPLFLEGRWLNSALVESLAFDLFAG